MNNGDHIIDHSCDHHNGCGYCAVILSGFCHTQEEYRELLKFFRAKNKVIRDLKEKYEPRETETA